MDSSLTSYLKQSGAAGGGVEKSCHTRSSVHTRSYHLRDIGDDNRSHASRSNNNNNSTRRNRSLHLRDVHGEVSIRSRNRSSYIQEEEEEEQDEDDDIIEEEEDELFPQEEAATAEVPVPELEDDGVKRVRFSVADEYEYEKPDFTEQEIANLWYTMDEMIGLVEFELKICEENNKKEGRCWRGLEYMKGGTDNRAARVSEIINEILDVYDELVQSNNGAGKGGEERDEALRAECRSHSRVDRKRAYTFGLRDAASAKEVWKKGKKEDPKSKATDKQKQAAARIAERRRSSRSSRRGSTGSKSAMNSSERSAGTTKSKTSSKSKTTSKSSSKSKPERTLSAREKQRVKRTE